MDDAELWAALAAGDSVAIVGLKNPGANRGVWRDEILVSPADRGRHGSAVAAMPGLRVLSVDTLLPWARVKVADLSALSRLRRVGFVDYVEPSAAAIRYASSSGSSGCSYNAWNGSLAQFTFAGDHLPPNYSKPLALIDLAWSRTRGDGVVLGLTDTGISPDQPDLLPGESQGLSRDRWLSYHGVQARPWYATDCSHGNRMASSMAAAMNGVGTVGVAWRAHLVSAHQSGQVAGVDSDDAVDGIRIAASVNSDIAERRRIVAMAFQADNWFSVVSDEIRYWHHQGRLFLGAAGTADYAGIAFPADMTEVVAVSAVGSNLQEIGTLNYGAEVELSFYVDQLANGHNTGDLVSLGGSSGATAVVSGQAALIWSYYPHETNEQIRDRLRRAAHQYPNHDRVRGYGVVNVMRAVGGMYTVNVPAAAVVSSGTGIGEPSVYQLEANPVGGDGPYQYRWSTGDTTRVIRVTLWPGDPDRTYTVDVTDVDPFGPATITRSLPVMAPPSDCEAPSSPTDPFVVC